MSSSSLGAVRITWHECGSLLFADSWGWSYHVGGLSTVEQTGSQDMFFWGVCRGGDYTISQPHVSLSDELFPYVQLLVVSLHWLPCPFLNTCPFFNVNGLCKPARSRLNGQASESIFQVFLYGLLKPCCKIKTQKMDGALSHLRCGKYTFIFVFSNNNNNNDNKKCLWKVSILYCGPEIDVSVWKKNQ